MTDRIFNLLFLCAGNCCRVILGEATMTDKIDNNL